MLNNHRYLTRKWKYDAHIAQMNYQSSLFQSYLRLCSTPWRVKLVGILTLLLLFKLCHHSMKSVRSERQAAFLIFHGKLNQTKKFHSIHYSAKVKGISEGDIADLLLVHWLVFCHLTTFVHVHWDSNALWLTNCLSLQFPPYEKIPNVLTPCDIRSCYYLPQ